MHSEEKVCTILKPIVPRDQSVCAVVQNFMNYIGTPLQSGAVCASENDVEEAVFTWLDELTGYRIEPQRLQRLTNTLIKTLKVRLAADMV